MKNKVNLKSLRIIGYFSLFLLTLSCQDSLKLQRKIIECKDNDSNITRVSFDSLEFLWDYSTGGGLRNYSLRLCDSTIICGNLKGKLFLIDINNKRLIGKLSLNGPISSDIYILNKNLITSIYRKDKTSEIIFYNTIFNNDKVVIYNDIINNNLLSDGKYIYVIGKSGQVSKFDNNGTLKWQNNLNSDIKVKCFVSDSCLLIPTSDLRILALNINDGSVIWSKTIQNNCDKGITADNKYCYYADLSGDINCVNINNGSDVWKCSINSSLSVIPIFDLSYIYLVNKEGEIIKCNKMTGEITNHFASKQFINSDFMIFGNYLIIGCQNKQLMFIDKESMKLMNSNILPGKPRTRPIISSDKLIIGVEDDKIVCYKVF